MKEIINIGRLRLIMVVALFSMSFAMCYAQPSYEYMKSILVFKFSENITWPNESKLSSFTIGVVGKDTATFKMLKTNSRQLTIKNNPVSVRWVHSLQDINDLQILYVDRVESKDLAKFAKAIEGKMILLISEESADAKNIMLNLRFYEASRNVRFEANKANIALEGMTMNPEILLLGGTEVDVRELYRDMKVQFEQRENEVRRQRASIANQEKEINRQRQQISVYQKEVDALKKSTEVLAEDINDKEKRLNGLFAEINAKQKSIDQQSATLKNQESELAEKHEQLLLQNKLIYNKAMELDSLSNLGAEQLATINEQFTILNSKEEIIELQKQVIFIVVAFSLALLFMVIVVFRFYRERKLLAGKLETSYHTLREQHAAILQLNEELNSINDALEERVNERTKVLEQRNKQLTEYAFINSHLLRAPLASILGLSNLLFKEELSIRHIKIVEELAKSSKELDSVVRKISDLLYEGKDFNREEVEKVLNERLEEWNRSHLN